MQINEINAVLRQNGINLSEDALNKLFIYHRLLNEWNKVMDLTNVPEEEFAIRHYVDSLKPVVLCPELFENCKTLIDVGTGAGLPGLPIAIMRPDIQVTLLETQRKRCDFLEKVKCEADLNNVTIIQMRAEDGGKSLKLREQFDIACARAVASLPVLSEYLLPFVKVSGKALCWKGPAVYDEMENGAYASGQLGGSAPTMQKIVMENADHLLVIIGKTEKTPKQYPRKAGIPTKKPLVKP